MSVAGAQVGRSTAAAAPAAMMALAMLAHGVERPAALRSYPLRTAMR